MQRAAGLLIGCAGGGLYLRGHEPRPARGRRLAASTTGHVRNRVLSFLPSFLPPSLPHSLPASTCCAGKALRLAKKHKITTHRSPAQHNNNNTAGHGGNQKRPTQRGAAGTSAWPAGIVWGAPVFLSGGDDGGEGVVAVRWQAKNRRPAATGPLGRKRNGPA